MGAEVLRLCEAVMQLSEPDRAELLARLLDSEGDGSTQEEIDAVLKLRVVFAPQARAEYLEVQSWYLEHGGVPAAERFNAEFARVSAMLEQNPKLWAEYEPGIRRALFRRFPYALHYMLQSDHI